MGFPRTSVRSVSVHGSIPRRYLTFVILDIFVPPEQVVDTVVLYYEPARHRKLSLRFLAWFLLKQDIQLAEHDSIEDARSALLLYKKYLDFIEEGRFKDVMEDIFESGKRLVSRVRFRFWTLLIMHLYRDSNLRRHQAPLQARRIHLSRQPPQHQT